MTNSQPAANNEVCVAKIIEANSLEASGEIEKAIALYQEIVELDEGGNYGAVAQQALDNLQKSQAGVQKDSISKSKASWWAKLSLKWKVTGLAIALGTIPVIGLGVASYNITSQSLNQQITESQEARVVGLADKSSRFMFERYGDIQIIAKAGIFNNPTIRSSTTLEQKEAVVNNYLVSYFVYDSIVNFDLNGNVVVQSKGPKIENHKEKPYFQEVVKTGKVAFSAPQIAEATGEMVVYVAAPIIDRGSKKMIGVASARMPVKYLEEAVANFSANGEEYHLVDSKGKFFLALKKELVGRNLQEDFPELAPIISAGETGAGISLNKIENRQQLVAYSPFKPLKEMPELPWEAVIGVDTDIAFALEKKLLLTLEIGIVVSVLGVSALAAYLAYKGTAPLLESSEAVKKIGQGELDVRTNIKGADELAELGTSINLMAEQIQGLIQKQEVEAWQQRQEKERLQNGVMNLLMDVEGAQKGDLTVQAQMSEGAVGSIADAFNATLRQLRNLLMQVQTVSTEVGELSQTGEGSVRQLSEAAEMQATEINQALGNIAAINESVLDVAGFAREAAEIARQGLLQAKEGDSTMDLTVNSIEKIRTTVASTSKQVKQLAESSQEIAQIVDIISGISEKTNLLAFNASVEAARAGEHGEGFRIVAEEVRRLADRITEATKDIQQLVSTIQQDTTSVLQGMETSTTEVVSGSELVHKTKQTLQGLAKTSEKIDIYLQSISSSTIDQTNTSRQVNEKITGIATIAKQNSNEAQNVVQSLRTLVQEAETLQQSVSKFKLQA